MCKIIAYSKHRLSPFKPSAPISFIFFTNATAIAWSACVCHCPISWSEKHFYHGDEIGNHFHAFNTAGHTFQVIQLVAVIYPTMGWVGQMGTPSITISFLRSSRYRLTSIGHFHVVVKKRSCAIICANTKVRFTPSLLPVCYNTGYRKHNVLPFCGTPLLRAVSHTIFHVEATGPAYSSGTVPVFLAVPVKHIQTTAGLLFSSFFWQAYYHYTM